LYGRALDEPCAIQSPESLPNEVPGWQTDPMKTQSEWSGPTLIELRAEGRLLGVHEARHHWERQQKLETAAEQQWLSARPWVGPLVWRGGDFRQFLSRADDGSIRSALKGAHAPINSTHRQLARVELHNRRTMRRCGPGHPHRCKAHGF